MSEILVRPFWALATASHDHPMPKPAGLSAFLPATQANFRMFEPAVECVCRAVLRQQRREVSSKG